MIFEQHYLGCLSQASYLIGDEHAGRAVVVDPRRDVGIYLDAADRLGVAIEMVIETHIHADFLSGHLELAASTGAVIAFGPDAHTEFPIRHLAHGERIAVGVVTLEILHTPGHTPESICIVIYPDPTSSEPHAVLTGDTMFIGDVGRPDLVAGGSDTPEHRAAQLHDSIHHELLSLPDATIVYPGHGTGSACGKNLSSALSSTIGEQRSSNLALAGMSLVEFVSRSTEQFQPAPRYFAVDADLNRRIRPILDETSPVAPLTANEVRCRSRAGAVVIDVRDPDVFAQRHLTGSINVPLRARFAELAGKVLSSDIDLILVTCRGDEREARNRLARIGFDRVVGYAVDLPASEVVRADRVDARRLSHRMSAGLRHLLLDVREPGEIQSGSIDGAEAIPLGQLTDRLDELDPTIPTTVYCASGMRSSVAASLLRSAGFLDVVDLDGGYDGLALRRDPGSHHSTSWSPSERLDAASRNPIQ